MEKPAMKRTLTNRNIQLIALGGAIGTGLFLVQQRQLHWQDQLLFSSI